MPFVWLNGTFQDEDAAGVSVRDTGLLHAAGVFTTMSSFGGRVFRLDAHLRRLRESCRVLSIPLPPTDAALTDATNELLRRNELSDARLRITVTRGQARQDPLHGATLEPAVLITAAPREPYPEELYRRGMTVVVLDDQKLNPYDVQAGHKTLNYFSRLAGLRSANARGAGEALWFNVHNYLQSGSISNVFVVKDRRVITPPTPLELQEDPDLAESMPYPRSNVLDGITRMTVMEVARDAGIEVRLSSIDINGLLEADEVFLTNSVMGVMPVCRIERRALGNDKPDEITRRLSERYAEHIR